MLRSRLFGFPVLLAVAAGCATSGVNSRTSVTPERGPIARIHATYSGGLTQRTLRADFTVNRNSYVLVGHLRGDGVIGILYPENATRSNLARPGTSYAVKGVPANYDGVPQLFNYASRAYRSVGARTDSYDGRGNGFVFIIASSSQLYLEDLQDDGDWTNDYEVADYSWMSDPREGIKSFADRVSGGFNYTLKYANSFSSNALVSYASRQWDCSLLSSMFGYGSMFLDPGFGFGNFGSSFGSFSWYFNRPVGYYTLTNANWYSMLGAFDPGCGGGYYSYRYSLGYVDPRWSSYPPTPLTVTPRTTPTPPAPATPRTGPTLDLPKRAFGFRSGSPGGSALNQTRSRIDHGIERPLSRQRERETVSERWSSPDWSRSRPSRGAATRDPESYRPSTRVGYDSPRNESPRAPVHDAPRISYSPPPPPPAAPAASAPASPPPKIEASSGKPRQP